jgi:hypothetical protein
MTSAHAAEYGCPCVVLDHPAPSFSNSPTRIATVDGRRFALLVDDPLTPEV